MRQVLSQPAVYNLLQRSLGADRLRYRCIEELDVQPGETVVDVGCGPAYYFDSLPEPIDYHGFDTSEKYIEWASARWGDRASFHLGTLDRESAEQVGEVDAVLLLGVLHHLTDEQSTDLLALLTEMLSPTGRIVTVDTCFHEGQGRISELMAKGDRGDHVRTPARFEALAAEHLHMTNGVLLTDSTRLPGSYWLMSLRRPA